MTGNRFKISLIILLVSLFSFQVFSQQTDIGTGHTDDNSGKVLFKPGFHYSVGSSFIVAPRLGSISAITFSPAFSIPLSPKLSVEGGIMGSYFYSSQWGSDYVGFHDGSFTGLAVYGSASYHFNPQLTLYGSAIKQFAGTSTFYSLPQSRYTIGSAYNFGNFSIGVSLQMSTWDNIYTPFPVNGSRGFYSPYEQGRIFR